MKTAEKLINKKLLNKINVDRNRTVYQFQQFLLFI